MVDLRLFCLLSMKQIDEIKSVVTIVTADQRTSAPVLKAEDVSTRAQINDDFPRTYI